MGNQILTRYDVQKEPCYYSTELKWRLHSASFKERPDDKLTIFLFEKKHVEKCAKNVKEQILEVMRKDASSLQRLRHPHILSVVEALSEERSTLAFATKPVVGTVAQLLDNNRHVLTSLEMKCGLLDVAEAIQFLHQDAKTAHLGLSPHSVFIDPQGKWLLGSLGNSVSGVQWGQLVDCPLGFGHGADTPGQLSAEPPQRYAAPEMFNMPCKCGLESDIFSLGLLTYELMSSERAPLLRSAPRGFTTNVLRQSSLTPDLYQALQKMLSPNPAERLTIAAFINSDFFADRNLRAVRFLEQLNEKDHTQREMFLKGLPDLLKDPDSPLCAQRMLRERVFPRLCAALLFPNLYGLVVPMIFAQLKRDRVPDPAYFQAKIWPSLKPLYTAKEIPIEVVTLFLKELDLQVSLALPQDQQETLLPFLLRCLELQEPVILHEVLEKVPFLHKKFEYRQVKDQILPRMLQLLLGSTVVKVKVQVLMGLAKIFEIFDKTTITDVILPAFEKLTKVDRTPAVCMCLLSCFDAMSKFLGPKATSDRIMPLLAPLLHEESLTVEQWQKQMEVFKKLLQRVEVARRKDFETRKDLQAEAGVALGGAGAGAGTERAASPVQPAPPQDFESLLMGSSARPAPAPPVVAHHMQAPAPPPRLAAPGDLLGGGLPAPTPSAPSTAGPMGGFDPFASPAAAAPAPAVNPLFAGIAGPAAPLAAPAVGGGLGGGGLGNLGGLTSLGGGGGLGGLSGLDGMGAAFAASPPAPSMGMPGPAAGAGMMRNMAYDPFAEIEGRAPASGSPAAGFPGAPAPGGVAGGPQPGGFMPGGLNGQPPMGGFPGMGATQMGGFR